MNVWLLSDGLPGHVNQARAIAVLLGLEFTEVPARLRHKLWRPVLKFALLMPLSNRLVDWLLSITYQLVQLSEQPTLVISAGGNTSFANALLARRHRSRNFFIGSLRGLSPAAFTAVFTLEPIGTNNNVVMAVPPSPLMLAELAEAGAAYRATLAEPSEKLWAMVIGGDGAGFQFQPADWSTLTSAMTQLSDQYHCRWLLTTSRRTGLSAEQLLRSQIPTEILADAVWYGNAPRPVMKSFLGAAERIFVTADSMSMLADAMATARPVYALLPRQSAPDERYQSALSRFADNGFLAEAEMSTLGVQVNPDADVPNQAIERWHEDLRARVLPLLS